MKRRMTLSVMSSLVGLALVAAACSSTPAAPTSSGPVVVGTSSAATQAATPSGALDLVGTFGYKDSTGDYHVVGLVRNGTSQAIDQVELSLTMMNTSGTTMLRDSNGQPVPSVTFSPALDNLAPGEASPFDYSVNSGDVGEPAQNGFKVAVSGQQAAQLLRAKVALQNVRLVPDGSGSLYVTGEMVNQDNAPAQITSYAAAALNDQGAVVADTNTGSLTRLLAPAGDPAGNDRSPFSFRLDAPGDMAKQPGVYLDAVQPSSYELSKISFQVTNSYFDQNKDYHLVGSMTNNDSQTLTIRLVAGLYDKAGKALDADTVDSAFDLAPGQSVPFDFRSFSVVGSLSDLASQLDHYTVQVDPYWTFSTTSQIVSLQSADDKATDNGGGEWEYKGNVTNTSGQTLSTITVVVAAYDKQGKLTATSLGDVSSQGSDIAPGEQDSYDVTLDFDPGIDVSQFVFKTYVEGEIK